VLNQILKLLHPFVPFVTEEIHLQLIEGNSSQAKTLTFGPWPKAEGTYRDENLEGLLRQIQEVVIAVRSIRSELNVPPGKKSDLYIRVSEPAFGELLEKHIEYFRSLARVENLVVGTDVKKPPLSASAVISGAEIFVPLSGLIDLDAEKSRLQKDLDSLKDAHEKLSKKLANADFLANAPKEIIEKEKAKKEDYQERIFKLNRNLEQILGW
jgi:valyl-tRNA synthetase